MGHGGAHDEIEPIGPPIGERDGRLAMGTKQGEDRGQQGRVEVGAVQGPVIGRGLHKGSRIADKRGIEAQLQGDRQGPSIAAARAEDRTDSGGGRASDRRGRPGAKGTVGVQQRAVHIQGQEFVTTSDRIITQGISPPTPRRAQGLLARRRARMLSPNIVS